jgi:hypothetical protein
MHEAPHTLTPPSPRRQTMRFPSRDSIARDGAGGNAPVADASMHEAPHTRAAESAQADFANFPRRIHSLWGRTRTVSRHLPTHVPTHRGRR